MMTPGEQRAVRSAQQTYIKYFIKDPSDLDLLAILGAENIFYKEISLNSCEGNLTRNGNYGIVNVNSKIVNHHKKRYIIAHELGHWYLHEHKTVFACTSEDLNDLVLNKKEIESEANVYASELLLPENSVRKFCSIREFSADLFYQLTQKYDVSLTAASIKFAKINLEPVCVLYCQNNKVEWSVTSTKFPFSFFSKATFPSSSLTAAFFNKPHSTPKYKVFEANKWFPRDHSVKKDDYIEELVIPMINLNACLTYIRQYRIEI